VKKKEKNERNRGGLNDFLFKNSLYGYYMAMPRGSVDTSSSAIKATEITDKSKPLL
jgi:hypothetical protein